MIGQPGRGALSLVIITMNALVAYQSVKRHHFREAAVWDWNTVPLLFSSGRVPESVRKSYSRFNSEQPFFAKKYQNSNFQIFS
jgi:hypothetical protein